MYRMILYSEEIWLALGEPPDLGTKKLAEATGASSSEIANEAPSTTVKAIAQRGVRRRLGRVGSARKARGILPAPHPRPGRHGLVGPVPRGLHRATPDAGRPRPAAQPILAPLAQTEGDQSGCLEPPPSGGGCTGAASPAL